MSDLSGGGDVRLPTSHYFITVARGSKSWTVTVRTGLFRLGLCGLALLGCWTAGSSLYLAFHDDLVASMMARQASVQYAYEDRIAALRAQVDQETSLQLVTRGSLEGKIRDLSRRAVSLETRASLVAQLADRAGLARPSDRGVTRTQALEARSHDEPVDNPAEADVTGSITRPEAAKSALPSWRDKPHPEADIEPNGPNTHASRDEDGSSMALRVAALTETLENVDGTQYRAMASIGQAARKKAEAFRTAVADVGLSPERFRSEPSQAATGGPFVPLNDDVVSSPFGRALTALQVEIVAAERLRGVMPRVPFASPLMGTAEVTSPFGARLDPFLGRPALHTGIDLREGFGTDVRATAAGKVVSAGPAGGYGIMIEIDHGNGLSTRYAHLSSVAIGPGQRVDKGQVVGEVGATGRATGPHLHYETRIDGEPVDPMRFLEAGQRLAAADPGF